jgi:hypothetical protein
MSLSTLPRRRVHRAVDGRSRAPRIDLRSRRRGDPGADAAAQPDSRFPCGRLARMRRDDAGMSTVEYAKCSQSTPKLIQWGWKERTRHVRREGTARRNLSPHQ